MSKKINQQFACSKMMLPEHRGGLQQHRNQKDQDEENSRPHFDEQHWERLQQLYEEALSGRRTLEVTVFTQNGRKTFTGIPWRGDPAAGKISFSSGSASPRVVRIADIVDLAPANPR